MNTGKSDALLGLVFFATLIGLGIVTIVLSDFALGSERHRIQLYSDDVGYLRPGDPVLLHGMASGKVEVIERLPDAVVLPLPGTTGEAGDSVRYTVLIHAVMDVDPYQFLREDYAVKIEERGLLGGKLVRIEVGSSPNAGDASGPLLARASESAVRAAGTILAENRANIEKIIDNLTEMTSDAYEGKGTIGLLLRDEELVDRIRDFVEDFQTLGNRLADGEGTLGKLMVEEALYEDAKAFASDIRSSGERLKRGEGSLGKLLQEDTLYTDVSEFMADARETMEEVREGQGTIGKLFQDDALYTDASETMSNLRELTDDAQAGKGTLGKLLNDETLYDNATTFFEADLQGAADRITEILDDVSEGEGLLATLINDKQLTEDFKNILGQTLGAIEDARETTPVTSLGSFLFGTF